MAVIELGSGLRRLSEDQEKLEGELAHIESQLAGYVRKAYDAAHFARSEITQEIENVRYESRREYPPALAKKIADSGSSNYKTGLGDAKAVKVTAYLRDIYFGQVDKFWDIETTPIPQLNEAIEIAVASKIEEERASFLRNHGEDLSPTEIEFISKYYRDALRASFKREADAIKDKQMDQIEDYFVEGGFYKAFYEFLDDLVRYPNAFLEGPIIERRKELNWVQDAEGVWTPDITEEPTPVWNCLNPMTAFPAEGSKDINHRYFTYIKRMSRRDLQALKGTPGANDDEIDKLMDHYENSSQLDWLGRYDTPNANLEWRYPDSVIDVIIYQGDIPGYYLNEWSQEEEPFDSYKDYAVKVFLVGNYVPKVVLNYHPTGQKDVFTTSFKKVSHSFWGESLMMIIRSCVDMADNAGRALANNMGIASGPQTEVNVDRIPANHNISTVFPWKIWPTVPDPVTGDRSPAVRFHQPNPIVDVLLQVLNFFSDLIDETSGIPKYLTGAEPPAGAGRTATGLSMLLQNSSKFIKQVLHNVDMDIIEPTIKRTHVFIMLFGNDESIKGDTKLVAKGATALAVQEASILRTTEFAQMTANEIDQQIMGLKGRANLLREIAKSLNIDPSKIVPEEAEQLMEEIKQRKLQEMQQPQEGVAAPGQASLEVPRGMGGVGSQENLPNGEPVADLFSPNPEQV